MGDDQEVDNNVFEIEDDDADGAEALRARAPSVNLRPSTFDVPRSA